MQNKEITILNWRKIQFIKYGTKLLSSLIPCVTGRMLEKAKFINSATKTLYSSVDNTATGTQASSVPRSIKGQNLAALVPRLMTGYNSQPPLHTVAEGQTLRNMVYLE